MLGLLGGAFCTGSVYAYGEYDYEFAKYHISYDIRSDRTMDVTVDMGVKYLGYASTGLLYDIPVNSGDRVRKISACEIIDGAETDLDYKVKDEYSYLVTVDMGDLTRKTGTTHYYRLKYEYAITRPSKDEKNAILLNAVGFGFEKMSDVKVTLNLPDGFTGRALCWTGVKSASEDKGKNLTTDFDISGNTVTLTRDELQQENGVTFELAFNEGVLTTKADMTPYYIIIAACVILALLAAVKLLIFNKDGLTPVTNVEAPDEMDPLVMGKLIDNKVDKSDVTSLIYYWANKGYLKIDMTNEKNPELIRLYKHLPNDSPKHQKIMYDRLFKKGDCVKVNSLADSFYSTVETVTKTVNAENSKLYDGKSMGAAVFFALLGGLLMGLTPTIIAITTIHSTLFMIAPLFMIVPAFIAFALTQSVRYNRLKYKKSKLAAMYAGVAALAAVVTVIYALFVPSHVVETLPKVMLGAIGFAIVMFSASLISRTEVYTEKLNKIVGFRDFIMTVEKDKLETMLESNPEFYYQVLPYAQVLGVSDIWENKFAALTIAPPSWSTYSRSDMMFDFFVFNAAMRNVSRNMTENFISRPSSGSYSGGGSHGGSFGGFSGGGHGGGGARGR